SVRSACAASVSLSVALLLPGTGSVLPPGTAALAGLLSVAVALEGVLAFTVDVAGPPTSRLVGSVMLPEPLAPHDEPADAAHVHVTPVRLAGNVSVTVAPVMALGPLLVTVMV